MKWAQVRIDGRRERVRSPLARCRFGSFCAVRQRRLDGLHNQAVAGTEMQVEANPGLSAYWQSTFAGEVPTDPVIPDQYDDPVIELEGQPLEVISIGQGDTEHSTILHAPTIHAVVGGDVVYNQVHMMTAETDEKGREDWIASLDRIAALQPRIVVSGHKRAGAADDPKTIGESRQYLRDFSQVAASEQTVKGIVSAMLQLHPDRDNPRVIWHCAREAVKRSRSLAG